MVVIDESGLYLAKMGYILPKLVLFGENGCIWAKLAVVGQNWLYLGNKVLFGQNGCIWAKLVIFG